MEHRGYRNDGRRTLTPVKGHKGNMYENILGEELSDKLETYSKRKDISKAFIMREALAGYLKGKR